jgi:predicted HicB family RNase H-like nuclease
MYKYSKAQIRANTKYESKAIEKITLRLRKDGGYGLKREDVQKAADAAGLSINEYVIQAIKEKMNR